MKYRITFRDWILRTLLELKSDFRYIFGVEKEKVFIIPSSYKLVFTDSLFSTEHWLSGEFWWEQPYHPGNLNQWYDSEQIEVSVDGVQFSAVQKSREFPSVGIIPNSIGLMKTKSSWKYGIFSFFVKLPAGTYLWPALWLSGATSWPPEIDLLEGYSNNTTDYHKNKNLQSNVHMSDGSGGSYSNGARTHKLPNHVTKKFIQYTIWWEEDFIKLYYNGYLVRHVTDREVLDSMFESQQIIIGTGTQVGFNANNLSPMVVSKVTVYQKELK